jgi:hypothetical protein
MDNGVYCTGHVACWSFVPTTEIFILMEQNYDFKKYIIRFHSLPSVSGSHLMGPFIYFCTSVAAA